MSLRQFLIISLIVASAILATISCSPIVQHEGGASTPVPSTGALQSQGQSSSREESVDVTPMPDKELTPQTPGQSQPGASASEGSEPKTPQPSEQVEPQPNSVYVSEAYEFEIAYPDDFVFAIVPTDELAQLSPKPVAAFTFMNPVTASSDVAELELADLEVRVYAVQQVASLESWLASSGVLSTFGSVPLRPIQTANVSGVEACVSTLIAPGCSYFFLGHSWAYQLIPSTLEGESMIGTLTLVD